MTSTPQALVHYHDFLVWLIARIEKFPRSQRHLLGARIETIAADVLESLLEAQYRPDLRKQSLADSNLGIEKIRHFIRVAVELKFLSIQQQEYAIGRLAEVGKQVGGWLKASVEK